MKLYIMYNGLYHFCPEADFTCEYHCCYILENNRVKCRYCKIKFAPVLLFGSKVRRHKQMFLPGKKGHFFIGDWVSADPPLNTPFINV